MAKKNKSYVLHASYIVDSREQELSLRDQLEKISGLTEINVTQQLPKTEGEVANG